MAYMTEFQKEREIFYEQVADYGIQTQGKVDEEFYYQIQNYLSPQKSKIFLGSGGRFFDKDISKVPVTDHIKEELTRFINGKMNALETFYIFQKGVTTEFKKNYLSWLKSKNFLLDSGAFSFMNMDKKKAPTEKDLLNYVDRYVNFINTHNVDKFFEMDVDVILGYDKVLEIRKNIETKTGKKCIPVWHKPRGGDEFLKMCYEYDYAAIGGIANDKIVKTEGWNGRLSRDTILELFFLCNLARKHDCKIHGLGFTPQRLYNHGVIPFYSTDSVTYIMQATRGCNLIFKNGIIQNKQLAARGHTNEYVLKNFCAIMEFIEYNGLL